MPVAAVAFWSALGYRSDLRLEGLPADPTGFAREFGIADSFRPERAFASSWQSVHFLFQVTVDEISEQNSLFQGGVDKVRADSYLFFAIDLKPGEYSSSKLGQIARELNRPFQSPILTLFKNGDKLTLAIVDRRASKRDAGRDVLEKVTLIKDINIASPHAAHLRILEELELSRLNAATWDQLHAAWRKVLDLSELNKKFYKELSDWYFWARGVVRFPAVKTEEERSVGGDSTDYPHDVRVLHQGTWFGAEAVLRSGDVQRSAQRHDAQGQYVLQCRLAKPVFAALNAEPGVRGWQDEVQASEGRDSSYSDTYLDSTKRRYREMFADPSEATALFESVPFLNGGLFECLDTRDTRTKVETRHDGFSSKEPKRAFVPTSFSSETRNRLI